MTLTTPINLAAAILIEVAVRYILRRLAPLSIPPPPPAINVLLLLLNFGIDCDYCQINFRDWLQLFLQLEESRIQHQGSRESNIIYICLVRYHTPNGCFGLRFHTFYGCFRLRPFWLRIKPKWTDSRCFWQKSQQRVVPKGSRKRLLSLRSHPAPNHNRDLNPCPNPHPHTDTLNLTRTH